MEVVNGIVVLEDLGMSFATSKSKRKTRFWKIICPNCGEHVKMLVGTVKRTDKPLKGCGVCYGGRSKKDLFAVAAKYTNVKDFKQHDYGVHSALVAKGFYKEATKHMERKGNYFTNEELLAVCKKYTDYNLFRKENKSAYETLGRRKLKEDYTKHMERHSRPPYKLEELEDIFKSYSTLLELKNSPNAGAIEAAKKFNVYEKLATTYFPTRKLKFNFTTFKEKVRTSTNNEYIVKKLVSNTDNIHNRRVSILHSTCNTEYEVQVSNWTNGRRCPTCKSSGYDFNKPAILYYFKVKDMFKVGVTNSTIKLRYNYRDRKYFSQISTWEFESGKLAYEVEQKILKENSTKLYQGETPFTDGTGTTECFKEDILNEVINAINKNSLK